MTNPEQNGSQDQGKCIFDAIKNKAERLLRPSNNYGYAQQGEAIATLFMGDYEPITRRQDIQRNQEFCKWMINQAATETFRIFNRNDGQISRVLGRLLDPVIAETFTPPDFRCLDFSVSEKYYGVATVTGLAGRSINGLWAKFDKPDINTHLTQAESSPYFSPRGGKLRSARVSMESYSIDLEEDEKSRSTERYLRLHYFIDRNHIKKVDYTHSVVISDGLISPNYASFYFKMCNSSPCLMMKNPRAIESLFSSEGKKILNTFENLEPEITRQQLDGYHTKLQLTFGNEATTATWSNPGQHELPITHELII